MPEKRPPKIFFQLLEYTAPFASPPENKGDEIEIRKAVERIEAFVKLFRRFSCATWDTSLLRMARFEDSCSDSSYSLGRIEEQKFDAGRLLGSEEVLKVYRKFR